MKLHIEPEAVKARKNQRKVDLEVADIRQKLSSSAGKHVVLSNREIRLLRWASLTSARTFVMLDRDYINATYRCSFVDLTEEDVNKIKGSAKVAKKLERIRNP